MNYSQIMSPRPPLPRKVGGHDPPAPMGAPPLPGGGGYRHLPYIFESSFHKCEWVSELVDS